MSQRDLYTQFADMQRHECSSSFQIRNNPKQIHSPILIASPHGGKIEPGTSEIAEKIAGNDFILYDFSGKKPSNNRDLHITSHRFDEPRFISLVAEVDFVLAIHGQKDCENEIVYIGGLAKDYIQIMKESLSSSGFEVQIHQRLKGEEQKNLCNRGRSRMGIQLELTKKLRKSFWTDFGNRNDQNETEKLQKFCKTIRTVLQGFHFSF